MTIDTVLLGEAIKIVRETLLRLGDGGALLWRWLASDNRLRSNFL